MPFAAGFENPLQWIDTKRSAGQLFARFVRAESETVASVDQLEAALERGRAADRTYVIALQTHAYEWTEGGSWWEVGVPEVSNRPEVLDARAELEAGKADQRVGW